MIREMKNILYIIISVIIISLVTGCEDDTWNEHYSNNPETINGSVWTALKAESNVSKFVSLIEEYNFDDSLFFEECNDVYTLFVPDNNAIDKFSENGKMRKQDVAFHILKFFIQPNNITGVRKVQTLLLKFAEVNNTGDSLLFNDIPVKFSSPLYENGRYFILGSVAKPYPSIYEYISENMPALKVYIDDKDSIVLDKERSKPLGFNEDGETIYDSVITVINKFEEEYFEVSEEFRLKSATLVFPQKETYQNALTKMALAIGGDYTSYLDIPDKWQQEVLIPYLLERGVFENQLETRDFEKDTLKNILGDDILLDYFPVDKAICSNGYVYDYDYFEILDSLYLRPLRTEAEALLNVLGKDKYKWNDSVTIISDQTFVPDADNVGTASNDSILKVIFPAKYEGFYSLEFKTEPLFPRRYLFVVRTHMDFGGIFDIYINDVLVKTFDWNEFKKSKGIIPSSVEGVRFIPDGRFNKFDFWVENITEYGKAKVRLEYKGPSTLTNNGLVLDYIECVTEDMIDKITENP